MNLAPPAQSDCTAPPVAVPRPATPPVVISKRLYEVDGKERLLLPLCWLLGVLLVDLVITGRGIPGLGVTVLVLAWYGVLLCYQGKSAFAGRENILLLCAVAVLASTFAIFSNQWLRFWNLWALALLMAVQMFTTLGKYHWTKPAMLWERLILALEGLCCNWGAPVKALGSIRGLSHKRTPYILGGLGVGLMLLVVVVPTLMSADALFRRVMADAVIWVGEHFSYWLLRLVAGLLLAPFAYGLFYALRRPREDPPQTAAVSKPLAVETAAPITVLVVMDVLYLFFLAVQFSVLFGGEDYLLRVGVSYADYARSGFFQLVAVAALNLTLVLVCLQLCKQEGGGKRAVRVLSSLMVGMSGALLASAALRMSLYVAEYGLSFKRLLTYWGMVMLCIFFVAALLKIWRKEFSFFRVLFTVCVGGWLVLNLMNVDGLVTRYNIARDLTPAALLSAATIQGGYLNDASVPLLDGVISSGVEHTWLVETGREQAAECIKTWQNWSLMTYLAAQSA